MFPDGYSAVYVGGMKLGPTASQSGSLNLLMSLPPLLHITPPLFLFLRTDIWRGTAATTSQRHRFKSILDRTIFVPHSVASPSLRRSLQFEIRVVDYRQYVPPFPPFAFVTPL